MAARKFEGELFEGHGGVCAVLLPFDPEEAFGAKKTRVGPRRHGFRVVARIGRRKVETVVLSRGARHGLILEPKELGLSLGDVVRGEVELSPAHGAKPR